MFVFSLVAGLAGLSVRAHAHRFHTTQVELRFRPSNKVVEASLLVSTEDLERAVPTTTSTRALFAYLEAHFRLTTEAGVRPMKWVGHELKRRGLWLYFQFEDVESLDGARLAHEVFVGSEPFILHTVVIRRPSLPPLVETLDRTRRSLTVPPTAPR